MKLGFLSDRVSNRRFRDETQNLMIGVLGVRTMVRPMGPRIDAFSALRHEGDVRNHFSPLLDLGSEMGLYFGVSDNSTVVPSEKGEKWSNLIVEPVSPSYLDGVELLQEGSEQLMLQWKQESGFLEWSPLSKWNPNEQKELEVI